MSINLVLLYNSFDAITAGVVGDDSETVIGGQWASG